MCVLSIKVPIRKKSGNLFSDPRVYAQIPVHEQKLIHLGVHIYIYIYIYI